MLFDSGPRTMTIHEIQMEVIDSPWFIEIAGRVINLDKHYEWIKTFNRISKDAVWKQK